MERHAGVSDAVIDVRPVPGGVHIRVSDQGRGFDPERIPGRLGYRNSIVDRVAEVGGTATIASAPAHGTTVEISWAVPSAQYADRDSSQRLADLAGTRTQLMIGCIVPILAYDLINAALHYPLLADPTAALAAVTVTTVVIIGAILWTRSRAIPGFLSAILASTALTATILGGWDLEAGSALALAYFAAGAGAPALCFVAFFRPWWESTAAVLIVTAAAAAMVFRADPGWSPLERSLPAVMANLVAVAAVLGARLTIDRAVRAVEWDEEMERQAGSVRAQLAIGRQVMADRLGRVQHWVLPFLTKLTCSDLDPADPAVRTEANLLEAAVRDDIRLGRHIDDGTRALIAQARATNRQVEVNADADLARVIPAQLISQLLIAALDGVDAPERTVLTLSGNADNATLSLLVNPPPSGSALSSLAARLGATTNAGPTFLLIRIPVRRAVTPQRSAIAPDSNPGSVEVEQELTMKDEQTRGRVTTLPTRVA